MHICTFFYVLMIAEHAKTSSSVLSCLHAHFADIHCPMMYNKNFTKKERNKGNNITEEKRLYRSDMRVGRGESNTLKYRVVFPFTTQHLKVGSSVHSILLT